MLSGRGGMPADTDETSPD